MLSFIFHFFMRYFISIFVSLFLFVSCMEDEDYTLSPNDLLTFSTDTVAFDTIISGAATQTYRFSVHNYASKAIRITHVDLERGKDSPFVVNVDGIPLVDGSASDFEIASQDSMIVYLMANLPDKDADEPILEEDKLSFYTEAGMKQEVILTASGQSVTPVKGLRITSDTVFNLKRPYQILDSLVVEKGAVLTLNPGVRLFFHAGVNLIVRGTLNIQGTLEAPVVLRGDRLGNMFDGQPYDRIPGQWGGVVFSTESYGNTIRYADIHSGQFGLRVDSSDVKKEKLLIENSILHNSTNDALNIRMSKVSVGNSQITNAGKNCVTIRGGDVSLVHCTIGRFYIFAGGEGVALNFSNMDGGIRLPLHRLYVANSIVTGYQNDEIMGSRSEKYEADAFNYSFVNCLLNTIKPKKDDGTMVNCYWDRTENGITPEVVRDKNFTPNFNTEELSFSFALSPKSQAVGNADLSITQSSYPVDIMGKPRSPKADIGCYQHVMVDEK